MITELVNQQDLGYFEDDFLNIDKKIAKFNRFKSFSWRKYARTKISP